MKFQWSVVTVKSMSITFVASNLSELAASFAEKYSKSSRNQSERDIIYPVLHFLEQLNLRELKQLHVMAQVGRTPSWLRDSHSLKTVYEDLEFTQPWTGDKSSYINYFLGTAHNLPNYFASCEKLCSELGIDPNLDLACVD